MSAKGRGESVATNDTEHYPTPDWCVRAIAAHLPAAGCILDPCAGDGAVLDALRATGRFRPIAWFGFEIDPALNDVACRKGYANDAATAIELGAPGVDFSSTGGLAAAAARDALSDASWGHPELVVTNPPYGLALAFVQRALREVAPGGTVAMLLRINWLGSQARAAFHREHPADVYVLSHRPKFRPSKKTGKMASDATEYAWFVWGPGRGGRWFVLDAAPPDARAAKGAP